MEKEEEFDFESFKQEALKGMYAGKPLNGEKGIFAPLLKHFFESAMASELGVAIVFGRNVSLRV